MHILSQIMGDEGFTAFMAHNFTRLPHSLPNGASEFKNLINWEILEDIFQQNHSILRIIKNGRMTKDYAKCNFSEAKKFHQDGHTLLIKNAEKSSKPMNNLAQEFAKYFQTDVDIQLYCTPEGHNAFGWHYDVEEVFIIQTQGSKLYTIRPNTIHPNPLVQSIPKNLNYEKETSEVEIKVLLQEGDFLYIPSGWWHIAQTQSESMHISIGLMPRSAIDIIQHLPKYLSQNVFWRTRLPLHQKFKNKDDQISFYKDAFATLAKDLENKVKEEEFILDFLSHYSGNSE